MRRSRRFFAQARRRVHARRRKRRRPVADPAVVKQVGRVEVRDAAERLHRCAPLGGHAPPASGAAVRRRRAGGPSSSRSAASPRSGPGRCPARCPRRTEPALAMCVLMGIVKRTLSKWSSRLDEKRGRGVDRNHAQGNDGAARLRRPSAAASRRPGTRRRCSCCSRRRGWRTSRRSRAWPPRRPPGRACAPPILRCSPTSASRGSG